MKSFIMSMFLLTNAFGSALGAALSPTAKDPKLLWMYTGLVVATVIAGCVFWVLFSRYNKIEESMNDLDKTGLKAVKVNEVGAMGLVGKTGHVIESEGRKSPVSPVSGKEDEGGSPPRL